MLWFASTAFAQPPTPPERPGRPPVFAIFDTDRDGQISPAEIEAAGRVLAGLDRDGDGMIGISEFSPAAQGLRRPAAEENRSGRPERRPPPPLVAALDADRDGKISAVEIQGAPTALETLDINGDGELTPDELHPPGPPPGGRENAPPHPGGPAGPPPHDMEE